MYFLFKRKSGVCRLFNCYKAIDEADAPISESILATEQVQTSVFFNEWL